MERRFEAWWEASGLGGVVLSFVVVDWVVGGISSALRKLGKQKRLKTISVILEQARRFLDFLGTATSDCG